MSAERWDRMVQTLVSRAGVNAQVHARSYPGGVSRSITIVTPNKHLIGVHDKWWRRNDSVWIGWQVHVEGPDSLVIKDFPVTKKRSEVAQHVRTALLLAGTDR